MGLRVKICGITKPAQGREIAKLGATALGFICVSESPRYVTPEQIAAIVAALPTASGRITCDRIGVFMNVSLKTITETVVFANLNGIQLHGDESPQFCVQLRQQLPEIELIKALRIRSSEALRQTTLYQTCVDTLLLDAYDPTLAGGTGKTLDWETLGEFQPALPWILAGGLTPANIHIALSQVHPDGIDLSSGVERSPGDKDLNQVAQLFTQIKTSYFKEDVFLNNI